MTSNTPPHRIRWYQYIAYAVLAVIVVACAWDVITGDGWQYVDPFLPGIGW